MPSVLAALGVPGEAAPIPLDLPDRVAVLLIDGMGLELLRAHPTHAPFLHSLLPTGAALTAGFPATTATSLTSLGTGLPPGRHGVVGYKMRRPDGTVLKTLAWNAADVDPLTWQPHRTTFERAAAAGVAVTAVAPGRFHGSGLTIAACRGARGVAAETAGERAALTLEALAGPGRVLVYTYYGDLDATGHRFGCGSAAWRLQLEHADRLAEQIAGALPSGSTLLVTADHGMLDLDPAARRDFDTEPELAAGVDVLAGESRARYVHAVPGAAADVLATWRESLGPAWWVRSRDEAVAEGWFGPQVDDAVRGRIGDVVAVARGAGSVVASQAEPGESALIGAHGGLTPAEQAVPLLSVSAG
jgi:predicted AlkP superfamily pyrophosphatase or phosphodiesterase